MIEKITFYFSELAAMRGGENNPAAYKQNVKVALVDGDLVAYTIMAEPYLHGPMNHFATGDEERIAVGTPGEELILVDVFGLTLAGREYAQTHNCGVSARALVNRAMSTSRPL